MFVCATRLNGCLLRTRAFCVTLLPSALILNRPQAPAVFFNTLYLQRSTSNSVHPSLALMLVYTHHLHDLNWHEANRSSVIVSNVSVDERPFGGAICLTVSSVAASCNLLSRTRPWPTLKSTSYTQAPSIPLWLDSLLILSSYYSYLSAYSVLLSCCESYLRIRLIHLSIIGYSTPYSHQTSQSTCSAPSFVTP